MAETFNKNIIRSNRKTLSIEITPEGLRIRAPINMSEEKINAFIMKNRTKIEKSMLKMQKYTEKFGEIRYLTDEDIKNLKAKAQDIIPDRVKYYAELIGVGYGKITVRCQKTRWGSCSSNGNINFNCLLMLAPPEVLDGVIVHELCHRKYMDHSAKFRAEVCRIYPDYPKTEAWLKANGPFLMQQAKNI